MRAFDHVPIPERMRGLPLDRRGFPVPRSVWCDRAGRPHFQINDENKRQAFIMADRCPICAGRLLRGRWFVGGPNSAFHEHGAYIDPPMHGECAHYALQVCPYLAAPHYGRLIDDRTLRQDDRPAILGIDEAMMPDRPDVFVAAMATGQRSVFHEGTRMVRFIKPRRPFTRVEFWRHGAMIREAEAHPYITMAPATVDTK